MRYIIAALILFGISFTIFGFSTKHILTPKEQGVIKRAACTQIAYTIKKGEIYFGEKSKQKVFYFIKNISNQQIFVDFRQAHIGATAWIGNSLPAQQWLGYVYVPGTSYLPAMTKNQKTTTLQRIHWQCYGKNNKKINCKQALFICGVQKDNLDKVNSAPLLKKLRNAFLIAKRSWWTTNLKTGAAKLPTHIFDQTYSASAPVYGNCDGCKKPETVS